MVQLLMHQLPAPPLLHQPCQQRGMQGAPQHPHHLGSLLQEGRP